MTERISREDCIRYYKIEAVFFDELVSAGLLETFIEDGTIYLPYEKLDQFEKMVTWHYDLEINIPGLEVIHRLLEEIERLR